MSAKRRKEQRRPKGIERAIRAAASFVDACDALTHGEVATLTVADLILLLRVSSAESDVALARLAIRKPFTKAEMKMRATPKEKP